jgi:hypothetical protein
MCLSIFHTEDEPLEQEPYTGGIRVLQALLTLTWSVVVKFSRAPTSNVNRTELS